MDKRGVFLYLAITLALSALIQAAALMFKPLQLLGYALLIVPVLAAMVARRMSPWVGDVQSQAWPVSKANILRIALVAPLVFAVVFAITTVLGLSEPDWKVSELMVQLLAAGSSPTATALSMPATPTFMIVLGFVFTALLGPTLCAVALIGMEYGWRGYLLPRLMPLGRWQAYGVGGVLWGLSIAPSFIFAMPHSPIWLLLLLLAMTVVLSSLLGEIWRCTRHIGLTAVCCGCFAAQAGGMWLFLFPQSRITFPWAGALGVVSIMVWALVAAFPTILTGKTEPAPPHSV